MDARINRNIELAKIAYNNATEEIRRSYGKNLRAFIKTMSPEQAIQWAMVGMDIKGLIDTAMSSFYQSGMNDMLEFIEQEETV
jgi:hypothetical protein